MRKIHTVTPWISMDLFTDHVGTLWDVADGTTWVVLEVDRGAHAIVLSTSDEVESFDIYSDTWVPYDPSLRMHREKKAGPCKHVANDTGFSVYCKLCEAKLRLVNWEWQEVAI